MRRNGPAALALPATVVVAALWIAVACGLAGSGAPTPSAAQVAPSSATSTVAAATAVAPGATPTAAAATASAPGATPTAAVPSANGPVGGTPSPNPDAPPPGTLSAGGVPVAGMLGSYCWGSNGAVQCADFPPFTDSGPDLPVLTLTAANNQLLFALAGNYPFASWSASYIDDNGNVVPLGGVVSSFDPDAAGPTPAVMSTAGFGPPTPSDESIVQVFVRFADGGDASYGWNVTVP